MEEAFLGGIASPDIGRLLRSNFKNGFLTRGYGLFFTNYRLIGISYKKIVARAYLLAYGILLAWIALTVGIVAWGRTTGAPGDWLPLPAILLVPFIVGLPVLVLVFLFYLSPKQAAVRIKREEPTSIIDLANRPQDQYPDAFWRTVSV